MKKLTLCRNQRQYKKSFRRFLNGRFTGNDQVNKLKMRYTDQALSLVFSNHTPVPFVEINSSNPLPPL